MPGFEGRQNDIRLRALATLGSRAASDEDHTWVSFRHCLKAMGLVDGVSLYLGDLGFTPTELRAAYPVMLHVEALVYQGDLECEESQKQGSSSWSDAWRSGIEEILESYGLDDETLQAELEELNRYYHDESRIMLGGPHVTEMKWPESKNPCLSHSAWRSACWWRSGRRGCAQRGTKRRRDRGAPA